MRLQLVTQGSTAISTKVGMRGGVDGFYHRLPKEMKWSLMELALNMSAKVRKGERTPAELRPYLNSTSSICMKKGLVKIFTLSRPDGKACCDMTGVYI